MRIGEFSERHGVTQDTVRYYLDKGLLVAEKSGGQYRFREADRIDLEKIIELKQLDFSLTEIQKILTFQRLSGPDSDVSRNLYLSFLEEKKKEVAKELSKYNKMNDFLKNKIHDINSEAVKTRQELGFPMAALGILACPHCQSSLDISEGIIEKNMVMQAEIQCQCGYHALIKDGIYIDETAVRARLVNGKRMPTKEEYLNIASHTYVNFLYKGMTFLIDYINKYGKSPRYIMEMGTCVGFFLLQYIKYLPKNTTYIMVEHDLERVRQFKKNLEKYHEHKNFIFLCCNLQEVPLTQTTIDIAINYGMTKIHGDATGEFLPDRILPLVKEQGLLLEMFQYVEQNPKGHFCKKSMLKKLAERNLIPLEIAHIGPVVEDNEHDLEIRNLELYQAIYAGRKSCGDYTNSKLNHM